MTASRTRSGLPSPAGHLAVGVRDARSDLGYGTLNPKFQLPRSLNSAYPYTDPDPVDADTEEPDAETANAVKKKSLEYLPSDPMAGNKSNPFYFAGGNTKLSDCFWRTDSVLLEIAAFGDSMAAIPQLNDRRGPSMTGYGAAFPYQGGGGTNYRRTGSLRGWSKSPPPSKAEEMQHADDFSEEQDIYSLKDLAKKLPAES